MVAGCIPGRLAGIHRMKKYIIAICVVLAGIIACTTHIVLSAVPKNPKPVDYTIYVYTDGSAQIKLDSINQVIQTHKDTVLDGMELKAGTIILPGNGDEIYYEYPRRDHVIN